MTSLAGKIAMVTGANSGLGKASAIGLAKLGATVIMVCRDQARGEAARQEVIAASQNKSVELLLADLSSQQAIRQLGHLFKTKHDRLHILVNNAGGVFNERVESVDGIEYSLAFNHLASFLLTNLLMDVLKASAPARIINVGTRLNVKLDLDDIQFKTRPYGGLRAYSQTKLGNIMFTYELAKQLEGSGVTVNCVHPGVFKSNLGKNNKAQPLFIRLAGLIGAVFLPDANKAAERVLYLATSPHVEGVSGQYFADKRPIKSPEQTYDEAALKRLWQISAELTHLNPA